MTRFNLVKHNEISIWQVENPQSNATVLQPGPSRGGGVSGFFSPGAAVLGAPQGIFPDF